MNIYLRHLRPHGFKGIGMFSDSAWHLFYYRINHAERTVDVVGNYPNTVSRFELTRPQFAAFKRGMLKLIPPGCCNAAGGRALENPRILFQESDGRCIRDTKQILDILSSVPNT